MEGNIVFYNNVEIAKIGIENVPFKQRVQPTGHSSRANAYADTGLIPNKYRVVVKVRIIWFDNKQIQFKEQSFDVTSAFEMPERVTDRFRDLVDAEIRSWDIFVRHDKSSNTWSLGVNMKNSSSSRR